MNRLFRSCGKSTLAVALALAAVISCCLSGCGEKTSSGEKNKGGYVMVQYYFVAEDGGMARTTYEYDDEATLLSLQGEGEYPNGVEYDVEREEYVYSEDGKSGQINKYRNDELIETVLMELNENHQVSNMTWYKLDGEAYCTRFYEYNKNGYCTKAKTILLPTLEEHYEIKNTYDKNGNRLTCVQKWADGTVDREEYTYDKNGHLSHVDHWHQGPESDYYEYSECEYDKENDTLTQEWYDENGDCISRFVREYDKHGNHVKTSCYYPNGDLSYTETYKYAWKTVYRRNMWGE